MKIKKILIANRGEIALRIIRTCRSLSIKTVAIYSDADQGMPYTEEADEAIWVGESPVAKSYLNMDKIIEIALEHHVDAIHPGYGLLSENAFFAERCVQAGLIFIGPNPHVIREMGDKITARQIMLEAGIPVVPGYDGEIKGVDEALAIADEIGYPIIIKASAGGGGIGMQVCATPEELTRSFPAAQGRAKAYFGNDQMFIEKYIEGPRHIEVQILADQNGQVIHLYERDCSIQRRHQKVVEESPAPSLAQELRERICKTAVQAAQAVNYTGVGTVEFILGEDGQFYFLEMNTRLQVEHPVTEAITGLDLVEWQIHVSEGESLPFTQDEITTNGHAIQFRVYAEDPVTFFPSPGKVSAYMPPAGEHIRIDDGIKAGCDVSPFYDPLIAKLIVWGETRAEALKQSQDALKAYKVEGIKTNIPLHVEIVNDTSFQEGEYTTQFLVNLKENN